MNIDNLNTLIAHLEAQPAKRINMGYVFNGYLEAGITCGCIYVHAAEIGLGGDSLPLDLPSKAELLLTMPPGWNEERNGVCRYPAHRVIATLKRLRDTYLATGQVVVDWGPEPSAGQPWSTPHVSEIIAPSLPAEITGLLRSAQTVEA